MDLSGSCVGTSYLLIEQIGTGATGVVWRALDRGNGNHVAVKVLRRELMSDPKAVTRFVQERSILRMLRHRNIVRLRDLLTVGDSLGLVMDLVSGGSLRDYLRRHGTLAPSTAAVLLAQITEAIAQAHKLSIVHRDLKPDNILVEPQLWHDELPVGPPWPTFDPAGEPVPRVRLTDFGIARLLDSPGMTTPQALVGTPNYLAPEVITGGAPTPAVDVYAIGVLFYELLLGRPPYAGAPPVVVLRRHLEHEPERHPGVPDAAWKIILACMAKDPGRRPSAESLTNVLRSMAYDVVTEPPAPPAGPVAGARVPGEADESAALPWQPVPGGTDGARPAGRGGGRRPGSARSGRTPAGRGRWGPGGWLSRRRRSLLSLVACCVAAATVGTAADGLPTWLAAAFLTGGPAVSREIPAAPNGLPAGTAPSPAGDGATPEDPRALTTLLPTIAPATTRALPANGPGPGRSARTRPPEAAGRQPARPGRRTTARVYGSLRCTPTYRWDIGHPVMARPCYALGPDIRLSGRLQALPGVRADVTLSVRDTQTGRTVAGPFTCAGLAFTENTREQSCGPFRATGVRHGRRYTVVQRWSYPGRREAPAGVAQSDPFRW